MKLSTPRNAALSRNAAAAAAGSPGAPRSVPLGTMSVQGGQGDHDAADDEPDPERRDQREPGEKETRSQHQLQRSPDGKVLVGFRGDRRVPEGGRDQDPGEQEDRDRCGEGPSPSDRAGQEGAERRPDEPGQDPHRGEEREDPGAKAVGERLRDGSEGHRVQRPGSRALEQPPEDQHRHAGRQPRHDEAEGEDAAA